ncbi:MAG: PL29 family lyase N-terminal domain-containing protein [Alistipes sp.]
MKKILMMLLFGLTISLQGCENNDDLWREIDDIKSRVQALETQIKTLNSNVEALQALHESGATITKIEQAADGTYTITLSNGKVLVLKQGSEATAVLPIMGIDAGGYWIVSYDNGKTFAQIMVNGKPVKASAQDGVTPKFKVDDQGFWLVSYDGGTTYEQVKNTAGKPVSALGSGTVTDKFFENVTYKDGLLTIKLLDGTEFSVPVVSNFYCRILTPTEGIQQFTASQTKTFSVEIKGVENTILTQPEGWSVQLSAPTNDVATLTVTAPAASTRAAADSKKDLSILATAGYYACIAKIQVELGGEAPVVKPTISVVNSTSVVPTATALTFEVTASADATSWMYLCQTADLAAPTAEVVATTGKAGTGTSVTVEGLTAETTYKIYVVAIKAPAVYSEVASAENRTIAAPVTRVDYYENGVTINGITYSKTTAGAELVSDTKEINANGVYFLDPKDATVNITLKANGKGGVSDLVIIGRYGDSKAVCNVVGIVSMSGTTGSGVVLKNIKLDASGWANYIFNFDGDVGATFSQFIIEDCLIESPAGKPLSYFSKASAIDKIALTRNKIHMNVTADGGAINLINLSGGAVLANKLGSVEITDNVLYSETYVARGFLFNMANKPSPNLTVKIAQNTFVNYVGNPNGYVMLGSIKSLNINANLMWASPENGQTSYLGKFQSATVATTDATGNIFYGLSAPGKWMTFIDPNVPTTGVPTLDVLTTDPFVGGTFDTAKAIFIPATAYAAYGSTLK